MISSSPSVRPPTRARIRTTTKARRTAAGTVSIRRSKGTRREDTRLKGESVDREHVERQSLMGSLGAVPLVVILSSTGSRGTDNSRTAANRR